jgi:alkylated DNA nucleotide flippase Atl1
MTNAKVMAFNEGTQFPTTAEMTLRAFEAMRELPHDTVVTYEQITAVLGLDPSLDRRARAATLRAGRRLLTEHKKKLVNVRTTGYRIVRPEEQVGVSQSEQRRARRWLRESLKTVTFVALDNLPAVEVARVMTEQARAAIQVAMTNRMTRAKELPAKSDISVPSADKLLAMMRKRSA